MTGEIAVIMTRISLAHRIERRLRDYASYQAIELREDDRKLAALHLAEKIEKTPRSSSRRCAGRRRGATGGWPASGTLAAVEPTAWTEPQPMLAGRLLGVNFDLDPMTPEFAAGQVLELTEQRELVVEDDAMTRGLVDSDLANDAAVPGLSQLRRRVRSLHRQMKW